MSLVPKNYDFFGVVESNFSNAVTTKSKMLTHMAWSLCASFKENGSTSSHFSFFGNTETQISSSLCV